MGILYREETFEPKLRYIGDYVGSLCGESSRSSAATPSPIPLKVPTESLDIPLFPSRNTYVNNPIRMNLFWLDLLKKHGSPFFRVHNIEKVYESFPCLVYENR